MPDINEIINNYIIKIQPASHEIFPCRMKPQRWAWAGTFLDENKENNNKTYLIKPGRTEQFGLGF